MRDNATDGTISGLASSGYYRSDYMYLGKGVTPRFSSYRRRRRRTENAPHLCNIPASSKPTLNTSDTRLCLTEELHDIDVFKQP